MISVYVLTIALAGKGVPIVEMGNYPTAQACLRAAIEWEDEFDKRGESKITANTPVVFKCQLGFIPKQ